MAARVLDGKYELTRLLGRGGMGEVHEATHTQTGRRVAVKLLRNMPMGQDDQADLVTRFQREARATGTIASPHIVQVLDAGEDAETHEPFMVMEYLEGEDLNELIRRHGPLPVDVSLRACAQACLGLVKAHAAGIVHRDIKPANLYVTRGDGDRRTLKILDFGIARMKMPREAEGSGDVTSDLTRTGSMLGSPHYMAPEQARGLKTVDARADVWSLGIVLYKMLCGRTPHEQGEGGMGDLLITICCVPAPLIQHRAPWVPPEVAEIVHQALRIEPDRRYPSAYAMLEAISKLLPQGFDIYDNMLGPLADVDRSRVAPRNFALEDSPSRKGTDRIEIPLNVIDDAVDTRATMSTSTVGGRPRPKGKSTFAFVGAGAFALALLAVAGVGAAKFRTKPVEVTVASKPVETVEPVIAVVAPPPPRIVSFYANKGAKVEVDGAPVVQGADGSIVLTGLLGSEHQVRTVVNKRDITTTVAITENGAHPPVIMIDAPPPEVRAYTKPVTGAAAGGANLALPTRPGNVASTVAAPAKPADGDKLMKNFE